MLTATVELWPYGDQSRSKRLVTICIANVGRNDDDTTYNYVWTIDEPEPLFGEPIVAQGKVIRYPREAACIDLLAQVTTGYDLFGSRELNGDGFNDYERSIIESMRNKTRN